MIKAYVVLADGFEELECIAVADLLKRGGVRTVLSSVSDSKRVVSTHGITIEANTVVAETDFTDADLIFLPGGMPGAENLFKCKTLCSALCEAHGSGKRIAAICAAPGEVLGKLGILEGKKFTCYPGFENSCTGGFYCDEGVVTDGNITTAKGPGVAVEMGIELVRLLMGEERAAIVKNLLQCK